MAKSESPRWPGAKMWPLSKIKPYPNNPRTHPQQQIDLLASLLRKFGPDQPIVVDEDGVILKGHGRLQAAAVAGMAEFPVVERHGLSEGDKISLRIGDNRVAEFSEWAPELMRLEIGQLQTLNYDLQLLGFDAAAIAGFTETTGGNVDPEEVPASPKKSFIRKGDLWVLGRHRLLCGDCTVADDVTACMGDAKPMLMVTDPPYGVDYDPNWRNKRARTSRNMGNRELGAGAVGVVKNDDRADWRAAWALFSGDVAYVWFASLFARVSAESLMASGFDLRSLIVWDKMRLIIGRSDYHWQHEPCWYGVRKNKNGHWHGGRRQTTIWPIPHQKSETGHGTQKPVECMKRPIENNSQAGDYVYDPFVGSGTTIIAAEMTGRRCLAVELDPSYCQITIERWMKFSGGVATLDGVPFYEVAKARRKGKPKGERHAQGDHREPVRRGKRTARADRPLAKSKVREEVPPA